MGELFFPDFNRYTGKYVTVFLNNGNIVTGIIESVGEKVTKLKEVKLIIGTKTIPVNSFYLEIKVISAISVGIKQK